MDYAIIRVGNKQHRVRDGETLVVDRVHVDQGGTFTPDVLLGDSAGVTVKVLAHERGPKIRIGKYRKRTGYKRHNGFRAATTRIEISLGTGKASDKKKAAEPKPAPKAEPVEAVEPEVAEAVVAEPEAAQPDATQPEATDAAVAEPEAVEAAEAPSGLPDGYEKLTVAAITADAKTWDRPQLEAALAYEQEHAKRKGALAALESALAKEND